MKPTREQLKSDMADKYRIQVPNKLAPTQERAVLHTPAEIRQMVGEEESVRINFVPQMLTGLAMSLAKELADHCAAVRLQGAKKHCRLLRMAIETEERELRRYYGSEAYAAYQAYLSRYLQRIATQAWLLKLKLSELVANQMPEREDRDLPILACAVCGVIAYIEWYDTQMDEQISRKIGRSVKCKSNRCLDVAKAVSAMMAEEQGCKISVDGQVGDWLNILGNNATLLAREIMAEEGLSDVTKINKR